MTYTTTTAYCRFNLETKNIFWTEIWKIVFYWLTLWYWLVFSKTQPIGEIIFLHSILHNYSLKP